MARTVESALREFGPKMRARFAPACERAGIPFPPKRLTLLAFKEEKVLEISGAGARGGFKKLASYPVLAASGGPGPKRREGDRQVPEGFYNLTALNPNSAYHLSIRVDYPNAEDIANRTVERESMGGDIYIHGNAKSIGCLAMGDPAIEEIWPLIAIVGLKNCKIRIFPVDFRSQPTRKVTDPWFKDLYSRLTLELRNFG